jgi:hypothetical protein
VNAGLGVREAVGNASQNVREWGRVVHGRQAELNKFAAQPGMSLETYKANLQRFDANYKPIIPTEW